MQYDDESAEFYSEKKFNYRIPRNRSGPRHQPPGQGPPAHETPGPYDTMYNHQAPYPSYPPSYEMPPTPRYEDYQYASPLAADQQYTQQHYDYHNQSYHATPAYANQQQSTNVVIKSDGPSAIPVRTERSPLKRKADPVSFDADLPADLKKLLQPLYCELCKVQLNSPITAKIHYESKVHEKKVRNWLDEWSKQTGNPIPEIQTPKIGREGAAAANVFHCNSCDIPFTSQAHAQSHYLGRKHQLVIAGKTKPKGNGYYDTDGIWHKTIAPTNDDNRFGIGTTFQSKNGVNETEDTTASSADTTSSLVQAAKTATANAPPPPGPPAKKAKGTPVDRQQFHCKLCNIYTTSEQLLQLHYIGAKHAKQLRAQFFTGTPDEAAAALQAISTSGAKTAESDVGDGSSTTITSKSECTEINSKYAAYRTPSGQFYCPTCNLSLTSESQLKQHLESKKHNRQVQEKKKAK